MNTFLGCAEGGDDEMRRGFAWIDRNWSSMTGAEGKMLYSPIKTLANESWVSFATGLLQ